MGLMTTLVCTSIFCWGTVSSTALDVECLIGLGRAHLMLGRSAFAHRYARSALALDDRDQDGMALCVRALIRARWV